MLRKGTTGRESAFAKSCWRIENGVDERRLKLLEGKQRRPSQVKRRMKPQPRRGRMKKPRRKHEYEKELPKAEESAKEYKKRQDKSERKAKQAAFEAMDEPEDSAQKAKKVEKHQKAAKKAKEARSEALEAEYAYRRLKVLYPDGNAPATINRIPLFEEKPPGWVQIANEQMKAWVEEQKKKKQLEKSKPPETKLTTSGPEMIAPFHRLQAQRSIAVDIDPWSRPQVFWNQSWAKICQLSLVKEGKKTVFYCGSQGCRKKFDNESSFWQHLNSKSGKPGHPSRDICKRWCRDQPYIPVDDPEHPIPEEVAVNQRDMYTRMEAQIRASRERTAEAVARAHAEGDASTSDMIGSDDFSGAESTDGDEVIKDTGSTWRSWDRLILWMQWRYLTCLIESL